MPTGRKPERSKVQKSCPEMGTDKNAVRYQDVDKHDSESALSPPFDLVRSVF